MLIVKGERKNMGLAETMMLEENELDLYKDNSESDIS